MTQLAHEILKLAGIYARAKRLRKGVSSAKQALILLCQTYLPKTK